MHYYQHHIGDFIRDTARLSDSQCMAYLRMIWHYYETEQPLENDADALAFRFGANASDVQQILKHYFFFHDGRWHNSRCDKEILAFRSKSEKAKKSANARWENANAMRTHNERNADEPLSDANQEPITNLSTSLRSVDTPPVEPAKILPRPESVNPETWDAFIEIRKGLKAKNTLPAIKALITQLNKLQAAGHDPNEVVMQSIRSSWKDLYALKQARASPQSIQEERLLKAQQHFGVNHGTDRAVIDITPVATIEADGARDERIGIGIW